MAKKKPKQPDRFLGLTVGRFAIDDWHYGSLADDKSSESSFSGIYLDNDIYDISHPIAIDLDYGLVHIGCHSNTPAKWKRIAKRKIKEFRVQPRQALIYTRIVDLADKLCKQVQKDRDQIKAAQKRIDQLLGRVAGRVNAAATPKPSLTRK